LPQFKLTGHLGAEPNMGITKAGNIYISSYDHVVTPADESMRLKWKAVYEFEPELGTGGTETADPMLWVDPVTDRIFASHMFPALICMAVAWSDDDGATWTKNEESCTLPGLDHQKFFTALPGPAAPPLAGDAYPTVAFQCYQRYFHPSMLELPDPTGVIAAAPAIGGYTTHCNISYDGGATWPAETVSALDLPTGSCGGINGHPAGAADGTIAVPLARGCDGLYVSISLDSGLTWTVRNGPKEVGAESIDPDIAFTPDGALYALWRGTDHITYLARSGDTGLTWAGPWRVTPPHLTSTVFQAINVGDDGRVAMAFLGTNGTSFEPSLAPNGTRWHLYIATTEDGDSADPTFDVVQVTPESNPVQTGCVWLYGGGNPCRNMLDFIDSAVHPDGTFYVTFTKGCGAGCTADEDKTSNTAVAWLPAWSLYAGGA
jgi:hypothetical protein